MNVIKELETEHFQERIDRTIKSVGESMALMLSLHGLPSALRDDVEKFILSKLDDYINHVASYDQRKDFLYEHEELPF